MALIKSISGIRGTIGGLTNESLTPFNTLSFACAFASYIKEQKGGKKKKIIVARDSRVSGEAIKDIVVGALLSLGLDVIDLGMAATPTASLAVSSQKASGAVVISASHNPATWNALKLFNESGEYLDKDGIKRVIKLADKNEFEFSKEKDYGSYYFNPYLEWNHIHKIESLPLVNKKEIAKQEYKIVVDGINSVGGRAIAHILEMLGVKEMVAINDSVDGKFAHNPEPLAKNLRKLFQVVKKEKADLGIAVDPDVDRLAFVDEKGIFFGEEYTLVAISDYVLSNYDKLPDLYKKKYKKAAVSNLSSSRALSEICLKNKASYEASAVGEVNVVSKMKENKAVIGGEGNGGIIFPALHYGRNALVGVALFLSYLATSKKKVSEIKEGLPKFELIKDKLELNNRQDLAKVYSFLKSEYRKIAKVSTIDGIKIDWPDAWVHVRASNTEPILRIYAEARDKLVAEKKVSEVKRKILANIR